MKKALLRYLAATAIIMLGVVLFTFYYRTLYTGEVGTRLPEYPEGSEWLMAAFISAFIASKYLVYELLVLIVGHIHDVTKRGRQIFYGGYAVALAGDLFFLFAGSAPQVDAGFAGLGAIFYTPWVLLAAAIAVAVVSKRKTTPRRAKHTV